MSDRLLAAEIAEVLAAYGHLRVGMAVDEDGHEWTLTVTAAKTGEQFAPSLELREELRYLEASAQVRAFAQRYGIAPERLDAFLARKGAADGDDR